MQTAPIQVTLDGVVIYHTHSNFAIYAKISQPWWYYRNHVIPHEWCPKCNNFTPHVGGVCDICELTPRREG